MDTSTIVDSDTSAFNDTNSDISTSNLNIYDNMTQSDKESLIGGAAEEDAEDMEPIPEADAQRDPYMRAWVRRNFGRGLVFGQGEAIEIGVLTREVCYHGHYVDGKGEHLSRREVDRYFYAHANASAAIWDMVDFRMNIS